MWWADEEQSNPVAPWPDLDAEAYRGEGAKLSPDQLHDLSARYGLRGEEPNTGVGKINDLNLPNEGGAIRSLPLQLCQTVDGRPVAVSSFLSYQADADSPDAILDFGAMTDHAFQRFDIRPHHPDQRANRQRVFEPKPHP